MVFLYTYKEIKILIIRCFYLQDCHYGIDWSGPVSTDDDSNIVIVPDLPSNLLTEHQRTVLTEELQQHPNTRFGVEHYM